MRKNLVVVRAGATSLHEEWLNKPYTERNFDTLVSFYSEEAFKKFEPQEGVKAILIAGGKWDGLFRTLISIEINSYEYFWLPDDDIATDTNTINNLFVMCREYALSVAQPSLTHDSYYSYFMLNQCPGFLLRYTNFVEIMAPCLSINILKRVLPLFEGTMSGFGLDYIWCRWPESGAYRVAILDALSIHHTRPIGKVLKSVMAARGGLSSEQEKARLDNRFNIIGRVTPLAYGGISKDGNPVAGHWTMALRMCKAWWPERKNFLNPQSAFWDIIKVTRRHLTKRVEMRHLQAANSSNNSQKDKYKYV